MQSICLHHHHQSPLLSISSSTSKPSHHHHHHHLLLRLKPPLSQLRLICTPRLQPIRSSQSSSSVADSSDLAPVPPSLRTSTAWDFASLWVGLVVGVPTYYLAGSLVSLGMSWRQGVATVALANLVVLFPLILTAVPGTRHGIPFPVLARSAFGPRGAHVPSLLRALVGCGWYGIETWIGGQSLFLLLPPHLKHSLRPIPYLATSGLELACFLAFWLAQLAVVWRGMDGIRALEKYSAPILVALTAALLFWSYTAAGGFGPMLALPSRLTGPQFWALFFPSLNANISFWATMALNIPDFSRYARTQRDQILGQAGLPLFMAAFTFVGVAVTSATEPIFGAVVSDPIHLLGRIGGGLPTTLLAIFGIGLATVTTNIAANVVAPANALVSASPSRFTFRTGALVTALLGIAFQPWRLLGSSESFVYTWLLGYSALMGPIGGIILADYYLVKRMELDVGGLYSTDKSGSYYYYRGYNLAAMAALVAGVVPIVPGFLSQAGILSNTKQLFVNMYSNAWFVSFFVAGITYWFLMRCSTLQQKGK